MTDDEIKSYLSNLRSKIRVTKIVATRSVKGKQGDTYAGFSASWDSVQDDSGGGIEGLISDSGEAQSGLSLRDARVAHLRVAMQADLAAHDAALSGGNISVNYHAEATKVIRNNYTVRMRELLATNKSVEAK